jgi:hypothetical protein
MSCTSSAERFCLQIIGTKVVSRLLLKKIIYRDLLVALPLPVVPVLILQVRPLVQVRSSSTRNLITRTLSTRYSGVRSHFTRSSTTVLLQVLVLLF